MSRGSLVLLLIGTLLLPQLSWASHDDEGPPIAIASPDDAVTFAFATIKSRQLVWSKKDNALVAVVTFTDAEQNIGQPNDDTHYFHFPGVTLNETTGIFYATTAKGVAIPVAKFTKTLFLKSVKTTPNAAVRVQYSRGNVHVILEAISPDDPAMHPSSTDPEGTHKVDINKILN